MAMTQLLESIHTVADSEEIISPSDFISGLRTRHAARRTKISIDVSDQKNISLLIDDICTAPAKAVISFLVLRNRWSKTLIDYPVQGCVARSLNQSTEHKIITKLLSQISTLSFNVWSYWYMSHM